MIGLLASAIALLVTVESAAGILTALWYSGEIASQPGVTPSLWSSERYFTWHILKSIPFLQIHHDFSWPEPRELTGPLAGIVVVGLKVTLLLPLARIATCAYWWLQTKRQQPAVQQWTWVHSGYDEAWRIVLFLLGASLLTYVCAVGVWSPESVVVRMLDRHLPAAVEIRGHSITLGWVQETIQWSCLGILVVICGLLGVALIIALCDQLGTIRSLLGIIAGVLLWLPLAAGRFSRWKHSPRRVR